ncbi:YcxB family protein [Paraglaciecola chathamensis]|uniref:YcxB family protein n=1 Tax=Paraglaciecola chathamensis TaxID=368405 RepID=UPI0026F8EBD9|nr:YcxB family protein [Paraglaciecola chathamensis]MDO6558949.1 YcxB family protein [Paraglaciecola chathamensis]
MTTPFHYSTIYILDKSHFIETYDASAQPVSSQKAYTISVVLGVTGLILLLLTELDPFVAWFIIALGGLEAFSVRYKKAWWLGRQLISKAANTELKLTVDEEGISSESIHVKSILLWAEIKQIESTENGWLLYHKGGKNYLSARALSAQACTFLAAKAQSKSTKET